MGDRVLIVAEASAWKRQSRLASLAAGYGYDLVGIVADPADAWSAALAGAADVILVERDAEVPAPMTPRFESVEGRRREQQARAARREKRPRPLIVERAEQPHPWRRDNLAAFATRSARASDDAPPDLDRDDDPPGRPEILRR